MTTNAGDLARAVSHDPNEDWPTKMEIVAIWAKNGTRGRRRAVRINPDHFFGRGEFGAPMSGEVLLGMVQKLCRQGRSGQLRKGEFREAKKKQNQSVS